MCKKLSIEFVNCNMGINESSSYMYLSDSSSNTLDIEKMIAGAIGEYRGNVNIHISVEEVPNGTVIDNQWNEDIEINENLLELNEQYKETIEELQKAFDESEKDNLNLRDRLMELENEVDYLRNGKGKSKQ